MRKITMLVHITATVTVNADDGVTVQALEDGLRLALEAPGADLEDASIEHLEMDVTDSR